MRIRVSAKSYVYTKQHVRNRASVAEAYKEESMTLKSYKLTTGSPLRAESAARKAAQARISPVSPRISPVSPHTPTSQGLHQAPYT